MGFVFTEVPGVFLLARLVDELQQLLPVGDGGIGVFFGLMFGIGGVAAAILGNIADSHGIEFVYKACSFFPLLGIFTILLPNIEKKIIN